MVDSLYVERENLWTPRNRLTEARDRHRSQLPVSARDVVQRGRGMGLLAPEPDTQQAPEGNSVGDTAIVPMSSALVKPLIPQMARPLVRQMGEDSIQQKRNHSNKDLWAGTPVAGMVDVLGDPEMLDVTPYFTEWDEVGWRWSRA